MLLLSSFARANTAPHHVNMFRAAQNGNVAKLREEIIRRPEMINLKGSRGFTPLHWASIRGRTKAVHLLLENGADISSTNTRGSTPILLAAWKGHYNVVLQLLAAAGEATDPAHLNVANDGGQTALNWAIRQGHSKIAALLLFAGADKSIQSGTLDSHGWAIALKRDDLLPLLNGDEVTSKEITDALAAEKRKFKLTAKVSVKPKYKSSGEEL
jgi:ankyrin repeat protein